MINRICWSILFVITFSFQVFGQVWTYDCPGGEEYKSPDYEVSIIQGNDTLESFVYYSYGKSEYILYNWRLEPIAPTDYNPHPHHNGPKRHSSTIFSFRDSVTVRIKIKSAVSHISLPLKSAKVLPSSYNIPCTVIDGNIIEFKLDRPEKIIVIPNYDESWGIFAQKGIGHIPIQSWKNNYQTERNRESYHGTNLPSHLTEGYQNPLFIFAHAPERRIPDSTSVNTLVVNPGDEITQSKLSQYKTVWFAPGVHDLSNFGSIPWYQTKIKKGQTFYLEGGSYVKARFKEDSSGDGPSSIVGRGIISGIGHKWVRSFAEGSQVINIDSVIGVTITDRACFGIYGGHYIGDVAMIGAWHGNTDGPDYVDNCLIENCFLQAHDDNLKINHNTHARHIVIWQGTNAHAIMVKETFRDVQEGIHLFANSVVEDIDIVAYFPGTDWDNPWPQISRAAIAVVTAMDIEIKNFTFKDIRIESPYLSRVISVYNLNTNDINPGWFQQTSENYHTKIDGITFSNISVNSPVIGYRSLFGSGYEDALKNLHFSNININGVQVTLENIDEFFEIECEKIENLTINNEKLICDQKRSPFRSPFQGRVFQFPADTVFAWQYDYFQNNIDTLFASDSMQTIGIYGCNDTTGLNIRSYSDATLFKDAAQFKWDNSAQTFSKNGQWVEYTVNFSRNPPYQLLVRARKTLDANFKLMAFNSKDETVFSKNLSLKNDFTNLGGANEQTDWYLSKFPLKDLWGKYILRFDWYDNIGEPGIFGAFSFITSSMDVTPPQWVFVSIGTITHGTDIVVMTNEAAIVYLVPEGTPPDLVSIKQSAVAATEVAAYVQAKLATSGLTPGNYVVYAIDSSNNISEASKSIILQAPLNSSLIPNSSEITVTYIPANDLINIRSNKELSRVDIFNLLGKNVGRINSVGKEVDFYTNGLHSGMYIIRIFDDKGLIKATKFSKN